MCHSQLLHYNENQGKSHKINNSKSKKDMVSVCENSFLNRSLCWYGRIFTTFSTPPLCRMISIDFRYRANICFVNGALKTKIREMLPFQILTILLFYILTKQLPYCLGLDKQPSACFEVVPNVCFKHSNTRTTFGLFLVCS